MPWGLSLSGMDDAQGMLDDVNIQTSGEDVYVVGPTVHYAVYVDMGTSKMEARPFVKPAAEDVQMNLGHHLERHLTADFLNASEEEILKAAALAVEKRMKEIITEKGAVDTGTMRASVSIEKVA